MKLWDTVLKHAAPREKHHKEKGITKMYRLCGKVLAMPLILLPITANQVSILGVLFIYIAPLLFALGMPVFAILAFYMGEFFDYADGIVARYRKSKEPRFTSFTSAYIGRFFHLTYTTFLFLGISIWVGYPVFGVIAAFSQLIVAFVFFARMDVLYIYGYEKGGIKSKETTPYSHMGVNSKLRKMGLRLAVIPMERIKEITLGVVILYVVGINLFPLFLIGYSLFLALRAIVFTIMSYYFLREKETELTKKGVYEG